MTISIGILAGMGPRSTAPFIDMLISECQSQYGACFDMDFPRMHIISLPTPFWPGQPVDDQAMIAALRSGVSELVQAGVSFIAVPCNLAHNYFSEMEQAAGDIPLLHIAASAVQQIPQQVNLVTLLATEPTLDAGYWQQKLLAAGKQLFDTPQLRSLTTALITSIKQRGYQNETASRLWQQITGLIAENRSGAVLIACTDISPLLDSDEYPFVTIDSAASLAKDVVRRYQQLRQAAERTA